jgi:diketogulonate reductase-like aldo/keto reductase
MITRREVLSLLMAAAGTVALGNQANAEKPRMRTRVIPSTREPIPVIGLGTYNTFDIGSAESERAPIREVLKLFVEHGGRVVDSSPMYGKAESVAGELAAELGVREKLFLATKVWTSGESDGVRQMEESLQLLKTPKIDLMQVHNLLDWRTHLKTLRGWKEQGRVRYIGVTHYTASAYNELEAVMKSEPIDFVQINYSIAERDAEARILPLAQARGIGVLVNRPFAQANLFDRVRGKSLPAWVAEFDCQSWAQFFLKYVVGHPAVTCAIPATSKPAHLIDNMQAGYGRQPGPEARVKMAKLFQRL